MLQIIDLENQELFTQISNEEAADLNGGAGPLHGAEAVAIFLTANGGLPLNPAQGVLSAITTLA